MGVIHQPWIFPYIDKNGIYGLEFHLYILQKLTRKSLGKNDTHKFIQKILLTLGTPNTPYLPIIYDNFILVIIIIIQDGWIGLYRIVIAFFEIGVNYTEAEFKPIMHEIFKRSLDIRISKQTLNEYIDDFIKEKIVNAINNVM